MFIGDDDSEGFVVVVVVVEDGGSWFSLDRWQVGNGDVDNLLNDSRVSGKFGGVAGVLAGVILYRFDKEQFCLIFLNYFTSENLQQGIGIVRSSKNKLIADWNWKSTKKKFSWVFFLLHQVAIRWELIIVWLAHAYNLLLLPFDW